jgi:hypothetical protein
MLLENCVLIFGTMYINMHLLVAVALAGWTLITAAAFIPLELLHLKDLLGFRGAFGLWIVNLIKASLVIQDLGHLLF